MPKATLKNTQKWMHSIRTEVGTQRFVSKFFVSQRSEEAIEKIVSRTRSGLNEDGGLFAPYTDSYAKKKGGDKVDLTVTGGMLDSLTYRIEPNKVVLFFSNPEEEEKAFKLHYGGEYDGFFYPPRPFLGFSDEDINFFVEEIAEYIDEQFEA